VLAGCAGGALGPRPTAERKATYAEPYLTAAFMAAYASGDVARCELLASPQYAAEWARRGASVGDRLALLPRWYTAGPPADSQRAWLRYAYVDGAVDGDGVGHLLYSGVPVRPAGEGGRAIPAVWRVDTDADGRVIWIEMVWLCSEEAHTLTPVVDGPALASADLPPELRSQGLQLLFGVRSDAGQEGYFVLAPSPGDGAGDGAGAPPATRSSPGGRPFVFLGVEPDGHARPGTWTYGQSVKF
jgi:hypothetical protein